MAAIADGSDVPADRFCDLVMKGGITSGVVYPPAIGAIARQYRFKNLGGTSAGAIAAALTAAAEYRRRTTGSMDGFKVLESLPDSLGQAGDGGRTQLLRLFQPDRPCRRLFGILTRSLNAGGTYRRIAAILVGCLRSYAVSALLSVVASVLAWLVSGSILAGVLALLITLPAFVGLSIYRDIARNVVRNNYGLCKGLTTDEKAGPALTPWLHELIQKAAGRPLDQPLTFGELWEAPGFPPAFSAGGAAPAAPTLSTVRSIDLQMFTTNLTHGRPYLFPHLESFARLFYNPTELAAYLPAEVMTWFNQYAVDYAPSTVLPASDPTAEQAKALNLREIPPAERFPIVLAARMSLSFPLLFAAVPLWAIDYEDPRNERVFRRCLFSDGGLCSNFPVHLFDGLIPQWPTFGINLEAKLPGHRNMIFLPRTCLEGIADRWDRFDQASQAASRLGGFFASMVSTMQNWNDNVLARMPGVRDRIVRVRLDDKEGGLNLNMPPALIRDVAQRGGNAAQQLITRFLGTPPQGRWNGWDFQRWMRLDVFIAALNKKLAGMQRALSDAIPHATTYADLMQQAQRSEPPCHATPLPAAQAQALANLIQALDNVAVAFALAAPSYPDSPLPEAELRVGPVL